MGKDVLGHWVLAVLADRPRGLGLLGPFGLKVLSGHRAHGFLSQIRASSCVGGFASSEISQQAVEKAQTLHPTTWYVRPRFVVTM